MLSETPKAKTVKTKLARSHKLRFGILAVVIALVALFVQYQIRTAAPLASCSQSYRADLKSIRLTADKNAIFDIEVASSEEAHEKGLSGRSCIGINQAMLFEFAKPGNYGFWMKDMQFDIDIVWLNKDKTITHIENGVKASSYPQVYYPGTYSSYVLELQDGLSADLGLIIGQQLIW